MSLLENIIPFLNLRLATLNYFERSFELCELVASDNGDSMFAQYCSQGEYKKENWNVDSFNGVSYWRKQSDTVIETDEASAMTSCEMALNINYPMKLVCGIPRSKFPNENLYTKEQIAENITKAISTQTAALKSTLQAKRIQILVTGYSTDSSIILQDEFNGTFNTTVPVEFILIALDVDVQIVIKKDCLQAHCTSDNECENLLNYLTKDQKNVCILKSYDFATAEVLDNLTPQQEADLQAEFGSGTVAIKKSDCATLVQNVNAPGEYCIPKHVIYYSDGSTPVTEQEFDQNLTIPKHTIYKADGITPYGQDEFDQNRIIPPVTPINTLGTILAIGDGGDSPLIADSIITDIIGTPISVPAETNYTVATFIDADAQAFWTAAGIADTNIRLSLNRLVMDLKYHNLWTKFHALYPMVGGNASAHSYNLKNTAQFQIIWSGSPLPTHDANGVSFAGAQYGRTQLVPSATMTLNSTTLFYYSRTNVAAATVVEMGSRNAAGTEQMQLLARLTGNFLTSDMYNGVNGRLQGAVTDSLGFILGTRLAVNDHRIIKNITQLASSATSTSLGALPAFELYLGARNNAGTADLFSTKQCAFAGIGTGLSTVEAVLLYFIIQTFQYRNNRQV